MRLEGHALMAAPSSCGMKPASPPGRAHLWSTFRRRGRDPTTCFAGPAGSNASARSRERARCRRQARRHHRARHRRHGRRLRAAPHRTPRTRATTSSASCVGGRVRVVDMGSTNGTSGGSRASRSSAAGVPLGALVNVGGTQLRVAEGKPGHLELAAVERFGPLLGRTPRMRNLFARAQKVAGRATPRSLTSRRVRVLEKSSSPRPCTLPGPRASLPFVTVDCGALSPSLISSELFGHERGAFTGADRRTAGAFERAAAGTVFLDEIGELPPAAQATLLGVLERRKFRRVGGSDELRDGSTRVVSATHHETCAAKETAVVSTRPVLSARRRVSRAPAAA